MPRARISAEDKQGLFDAAERDEEYKSLAKLNIMLNTAYIFFRQQ